MTGIIRLAPLDNAIQHHHHDYHQIVIGLSGYAEFEIAGQGGVVAPLSGCMVPANIEHYYEGIGDNRQLIIDLPDDAAALTGTHRQLRALFDRPGYFAIDESLQHYLQFLVQEMAQARHAPGDLLVTTLLSSLHARLGATLPPPPVTRRASRSLDIQRLEHFVLARLDQRLSVSDLANLVCLSEAHFSERFRDQTGITPYQFVMRLRLATARDLTDLTDLPLADIAERTGFANQSALSNAFRRRYGHSPVQLRRPSSAR
ncbi:AraC family transcriptional regulator [Salinicola sp. MH3R3-1]|uniref:AraC family transcriptional regulator n=1 Tax=Salinicola sp. MH3R3-1 TaxID=1928762 RepID=UPI00094E0782|nr:helix-turn-helix domain-containing protein [Salinicola sp. MH3R3-1]OLO07699.1 AraC family transcriptional regulator [Salinicola sp. MH3R3-1]